MKVIYTPEIFTNQRFGGISRYFVELAGQLRAAGERAQIVAGFHVNGYLRGQPGVFGVYAGVAAHRGTRLRTAINQGICRAVLSAQPRTVAHLSYYTDTSYLGSRRPLVVTVYDMIHELFHERYPGMGTDLATLHHKRRNCERADHIIAISETTRTDLIRLFGIEPAKVTTVLLGNSIEPSDQKALPAGDEEAFLLYVGSRAHYKNFDAFLEAYARCPAALRQRCRVVCFGGGAFTAAERARMAALGVADRVEHRAGDDDALAHCYRRATAFVYPSLYEGFGLPLVEAMGQDCPVICARAGSLPEVAGDAAAYFDPTDVDSIRIALETSLDDPARLAALRQAGKERARAFTWERCARETLEVYKRLAP